MNKKKGCFAMLAMTKKSFAFTLAEVLIVLAVLGVIAAMTIPTLIQDAREKALITALKKNYTVFSQAVDMAIADNGPINTWDIGALATEAGALKLYNILKPYLRIEKDCGIQIVKGKYCFAEHYGALFNENYLNQPATRSDFARGVLSSGVSFATWSHGSGCSAYGCGIIAVDVNGKSGPNKAGMDYFWFILYPEGLEPAGYRINSFFFNAHSCAYNDSSSANGSACTYWALKQGNMDYLRKAGTYYGH